MKKAIRYGVALLLVIAMAITLLSGCTSKQTGTQPIKLTVWINAKDSYISAGEQKKSQDEWYISQAIKRFETQNPNVTIELILQSDALLAHQTFKTAGLAGSAPDIANLWSGQFIFPLKDVMTPINDYVPKEDLQNIMGWNTVTLDFKEGGPIFGYPVPDNQMCFFLYNKTIIKDCGLDYENNPPRTKDKFLADMQIIKNKGYTPMVADEGAGYPYYFFYISGYWWVQETGIEQILLENNGQSKFADDQGLIDALNLYHEIYAKGYMNQDAATSADSWSKFLNGTVAMYPATSFMVSDAQAALGEDNVGGILPPDISENAKIKNSLIGGPGQCLVVSKDCKNVEMTVKFLSFLNSKSEVLKWYQVQMRVPVRNDISESDLNLKPGSIGSKMLTWSKNYVYWVDNSLSPWVVDDFNKLLPLVLVGKMSSEDFAKQLDKDKVQH